MPEHIYVASEKHENVTSLEIYKNDMKHMALNNISCEIIVTVNKDEMVFIKSQATI